MTARGASARTASAVSLGAAAFGAATVGTVAIGALAIRRLVIRRGRVGRLSIGDLEMSRLRVSELVVEKRGVPRPFEVLEGHSYANLTTHRKGGEGVVCRVRQEDLHHHPPPDSGKMKRIRNDPRVALTPSTVRGKSRGGSVRGIARPIVGAAPEGAERALREKYRTAFALFRLFGRGEVGLATLEIGPEEREGV